MAFLKSKNHKSIMTLFQSDPDRYGPLGNLTSALMDADSQLTRAEREEIALFTSGLNGCAYCIGDHSAVLENLGVDKDRINAAAAGSTAAVNGKMHVVLTFVEKLTKRPSTLKQTDLDVVLEAGCSEQCVEDIIGICALFNLFNRLILGTGLKASPQEHAAAGRMLSNGYGGA